MYRDDVKGACETGFSEVDKLNHIHDLSDKSAKKIRIQYFTDPFSPAGYAMEEQLNKLTGDYGQLLEVEYHMGGLIPLWELYRNNGISTHADMAKHWKGAGEMYNLPINGSVWLIDPPHSSFPPSIAFKAAQIQDRTKALALLQRMREMLFLENKNISKWEYLEKAAVECNLDIDRLKKDHTGTGRKHFEEDLLLAERLEVMGFPTLIIVGADVKRLVLEGYQRIDQLEQSLVNMIKPDSDAGIDPTPSSSNS